MKHKVEVFAVAAIAAFSIAFFVELRVHDDCPSACRASSAAKQIREVMVVIEGMAHLSLGSANSRSFESANQMTSYRSPYIEKLDVKNNGLFIVVGTKDSFNLMFEPKFSDRTIWDCYGSPENVVRNIEQFLDPKTVNKCKIEDSKGESPK